MMMMMMMMMMITWFTWFTWFTWLPLTWFASSNLANGSIGEKVIKLI